MLRWHVGDQPAAQERRFVVEPHLPAHDEIAIEQAADAHQHNRAVGRQIANFVGGSLLGGHHPASAAFAFTRLQLDFPTAGQQRLPNAVGGRLGALIERLLGAAGEGLQALLADVFFEGLEVDKNFGRVARNAQAGAGDQKRQNQQEPPSAVDREQVGAGEHIGPERTELVHVVVQRLVLFDDRADHRGDADHSQQGDREPHRRQQLDQRTQHARAGFQLQALGRNGHMDSTAKKHNKKRAGLETPAHAPL